MSYNAETLSFEVPDTDTVYVSGLPTNVTEADIAAHFGSIGVLKQDKKAGKPKIWLYKDKATGGLKVSLPPSPDQLANHTSCDSLLLSSGSAKSCGPPRQSSRDAHAGCVHADAGQGDGTVAYEDPFSAGSAVQWFNGKEFQGFS